MSTEDPPKPTFLATIPDEEDPQSLFENMDSKHDDLQPTEVSPCIPPDSKPVVSHSDNNSSNPSPLPNSSSPKKKIKVSENGRMTRVIPTRKELEERVRKRFGVNREGFLIAVAGIVLIVVCLFVILLMTAFWPRLPHAYQYPVCTRAPCLRASAVIIPRMDSSASPCLSLYNYSCGGWREQFPKPPPTRERWSPRAELHLTSTERLRDVIATLPHPTRVNALTWKIKYFYESCMAIDNIETDSKRPIKKIINELGGWNVLREFSVLAWDFSQALVRIQSEYGVSPFFKITVVANSYNYNATSKNNHHIIKLAPSGLGLPDLSFYQRDMNNDRIVAGYRNFMKDVVQLLGATSTDAKSFADDMFYFERRIAEITPSDEELTDTDKYQILTVAQLKTNAPSIPIHEILTALLPTANIDDNTPLLVISPKYMAAISNIMATTDRSALNNYFMWNLAKMYIPYLSQDILDIQFVYDRERKGVTAPLERWEICIETMRRFQSVALSVKLQQSVNEDVRLMNEEIIKKMFLLIRSTIRESVTKAEWIDLELYQHIIKKLDEIKLHVGFPDEFADDLYLEDYYSKLFVQKNDFFQNIRYGVSFLHYQMLRRYTSPREELKWLSQMSKPEISYVPSANKILVPQTILVEPYFHKNYPPSIVYARLGVELAQTIISAIFGPSGLLNADGVFMPKGSLVANLTTSVINTQLNCLNNNRTALDTFIKISAVRQALKALKKDGKERVHVHQPGLENFEDDALFVISLVQEQCTVLTTQQLDLETVTSHKLPSEQLVLELSRHLKTGEAFGCSQSSAACKHFL